MDSGSLKQIDYSTDGRLDLFDDDSIHSVWRKQPIGFGWTSNPASDPCLHYEFEIGIHWTRAAKLWQPFITLQLGKRRFQIGWLY